MQPMSPNREAGSLLPDSDRIGKRGLRVLTVRNARKAPGRGNGDGSVPVS